ncbi:MAG: riboflavin synthase [Chitinophagia bacterium]|nr:riboflavin synthase [Chitinophagia bacterium]
MFTGIIESLGKVISATTSGTNKVFWIESPISEELKIDQSVSHNGVCLTVEEIKGTAHRVTAIQETLQKTNCGNWIAGTAVNLERCLLANGRLDGHLVQGHVDTTGTCLSREDANGSWLYRFEFPEKFAPLIIEKGSIAINGISLTCFNVTANSCMVAIIPYTFNHTNLQWVEVGAMVNIEFDLMGKYILRMRELSGEK